MEDDNRRSHQVYVRLRNAILDGDLVADSAISQVQLAKQLGVSRTPLREALRTLEREGLVESLPNRRTRVAAFEPRDLDELYGTRIMLECLGIMLAVPLMEDSDLEELATAQAEMTAFAESQEHDAWEVPHARFHEILRAHMGERLLRQSEELSDHAERYRRVYLHEPRAWVGATREHDAIEAACRERNQILAAELRGRQLARTALTLLVEMAPHYEPRATRGAMQFIEAFSTASDTKAARQSRAG